jgi:hypothetical protein
MPQQKDPLAKPMPHAGGETSLPPAYPDQPLVTQQLPEQQEFLAAYERVGRPRIAVLVNRTPDSAGPFVLPDGRQVQASAIDYEDLETMLTDWLAAGGKVNIVSPGLIRQHQESKNTGATTADDADVIVQMQISPTRQTRDGIAAARMVGEAFNTRGGQQIARAVVDVPPPLDKVQINQYTRYVARKLMDEMTSSWESMGRAAPPPAAAPPPPASGPNSPPPAAPTPPPAPSAPPAPSVPPPGPVTTPSTLPASISR